MFTMESMFTIEIMFAIAEKSRWNFFNHINYDYYTIITFINLIKWWRRI